MKRIDVFDSLRGIAIIGVILIHSGNNVPRNFGMLAEAIISNGNKGVQIFFIISAILFYRSFAVYCNKYPDMRLQIVATWYGKRFLRLIPLFWLTNTAVLLYSGIKDMSISVADVKIYISNCLFLHGFIPKYINAIGNNWYIGTLAIFILLVPFIYRLVNNIWKACALFGIAWLLQQMLERTVAVLDCGQDMIIWQDYWKGFSIFKQMPVLAIGIILYFLLFHYEIHLFLYNKLVEKFGKTGAAVVLYVCFFALCGSIFYAVVTYQNIYRFAVIIGLLLIVLFCYPIPLIVNRFYSFIGKYSYGIYLFHLLLLGRINNLLTNFIDDLLINVILATFITLFVCLFASVVATNYFERPIINVVQAKMTKGNFQEK